MRREAQTGQYAGMVLSTGTAEIGREEQSE